MRPATPVRTRLLVALVATLLGPGLAGSVAGSASGAGAADRPGAAARAGATEPASYAFLRARVYRAPGLGSIAVGAPTPRRVMVQRLEEATGTWTEPRLLFLGTDGRTCGDIGGRASAGGVALLLECDTSYSEDQAPAESVALVTRDLRTWGRLDLPGESYGVPAISPQGEHAAWPAAGLGGFVQWSQDTGFSGLRTTTYQADNGGSTLVVTDDGTVSVLGPQSTPEGCVVGVHERTLAGGRSSTTVEGVDPGCTEGSLVNRDALAVVGGGSDRATRFVVGRADADSPWRLTQVAPASATGLVDFRGAPRRAIRTGFSDARGQALVAYGSPDRQRVLTQRYDVAAQRWEPAVERYDHGFPGCGVEGDFRAWRLAVHAVSLHCYPQERADGDYPPYTDGYQVAPRDRVRVLLSPDGLSWRVVDIADRPLGVSLDARLVAAPGARTTTVVSPDGVAVLPVRAPATCGFVVPIGPERLLRLHGTGGWPRLLQRLDGGTWRTIQRVRVPRTGACTRVRAFADLGPTTYVLDGGGTQVALRVVRRDGAWRVVQARGW